jgi:uncharacterized protein GlcG (DUF336 family)
VEDRGIGIARSERARIFEPFYRSPSATTAQIHGTGLGLALAKTIAEATIAECQAKGFHTAAAVVDRAGQVLVILRDEQGTAQMAEMARRKAYTARMFRMPTAEFQKRTANDPSLLPQRDVQDILALGGGMPIQTAGEVIGGVGSSGSSQETDEGCAKAGLAKVADQLR